MPSFTMDGTTIFSKSGSDITYSAGNLTGALADSNTTYPAGHIIQVKGNRSNYNWGTISNNNVTPWTWCTVTMTAKQSGSMFRVSGTIRTENSGSGSYGVGVGLKYTINGGSDQIVKNPSEHENYLSGAADMYILGHIDILVHNDASMTDSTSAVTPTSGLINATAGDTIVWTPNVSFNNSNGAVFMGNNVSNANPYFNTECIVMEIAK